MKNHIKRIYLVNSVKIHFRFMFQIIKKSLKLKSKPTSLLKVLKSEIALISLKSLMIWINIGFLIST